MQNSQTIYFFRGLCGDFCTVLIAFLICVVPVKKLIHVSCKLREISGKTCARHLSLSLVFMLKSLSLLRLKKQNARTVLFMFSNKFICDRIHAKSLTHVDAKRAKQTANIYISTGSYKVHNFPMTIT